MHLLLTLAAVQFLSSPAPTDDSLTFRRQLPYFATRDLSGRTWRPADLQDKFTVVDIWATWCAPCRKQHPELQRFYEKLNPRIQILSIAVEEQPELVRLYLTRNHYTFPVIADPSWPGSCSK